MNARLLLSLAPVAAFFVLNQAGQPAAVSVGVAFVASTLVFYLNRRHRLIGALALFGFVIVAVSSTVGVVADSEKAYLASGPIADFLFVPLYLGSIAIRQPLVGGISRELVPAVAGRLPVNAPVYVGLSLAWAAHDAVVGVVRVYLLANLSPGEYVIWSRVVSWPVSAVLLAVTGWLIYRAALRLSVPRGARQWGPA